ncbi:hypothetical protein FKW77_006777 [Venturia effusa]|uniref:Uncharacterized protein n=1 Tax=Venturia effusa TaxID=50376 RepID=A0A517LCN5_9PEZI|nr:hypothetical protein FKW77_006777 [Venturia effusa]
MPFGLHRRRTDQDNEKDSDDATSFRRRTTLQFGASNAQRSIGGLEEDRFSSYNGLMTWEKFKSFLQEKFPAHVYPDLDPEFSMRLIDDYFVVEIPEKLTDIRQDDRKALQKLRDKGQSSRRRGQSPPG